MYWLKLPFIWIPKAVNKWLEMERQNEGRTKSSGMRVTQEALEILILKGIKDTQLSQAFHLFPVPVVALGLYEYDVKSFHVCNLNY